MNNPTEIIIHCSATPVNWMAGQSVAAQANEIDRWHRDRGWRGIGYHAVLGRIGQIVPGRPEHIQGAHTKGRNKDTLAICLIGGHGSASTDDFFDNFTVEQDASLREWIKEKIRQYPTIKGISGHNQYAAKACPGFNVKVWWENGK